MRRSIMNVGGAGPSAFTHLLRLLTGHFRCVDQSSAFVKHQNIGVASGTPFTDYLRAFQVVVASATGSTRHMAPGTAIV